MTLLLIGFQFTENDKNLAHFRNKGLNSGKEWPKATEKTNVVKKNV